MIKHLHILCLYLLFVPVFEAGAQSMEQIRHTPWQQSLNPAGIQFTPLDSLLEAQAGYGYTRVALPTSDSPDLRHTYGASVEGLRRIGRLQLAGGLSWQEEKSEGHAWNFLVLPDNLVAIGDTLGGAQRVEQYAVYAQAAFALSPRLTVGVGAHVAAYSNEGLAAGDYGYSGRAQTATFAAGLIRSGRRGRVGLTFGYAHQVERLSYVINAHDVFFSFPLGYYLPVGDVTSGVKAAYRMTRNIGNLWQAALQGEWQGATFTYFNELSATLQGQTNNFSEQEKHHGWKERFRLLAYRGHLSLPRHRWMHFLSPAASWQEDVSSRMLQLDGSDGNWLDGGLLRLSSRRTADVCLSYCLTRDYSTTDAPSLAWQFAAGWQHRREEFYTYPFTIAQQTGTYRAEAAFVHRLALPGASRLVLRPSLLFAVGSGVAEEVSRAANVDTQLLLYRDSRRSALDYAARTAPRLALALQSEYRRPLSRRLDIGLRLHAGFEQVVRSENERGGQVMLSLLAWLY